MARMKDIDVTGRGLIKGRVTVRPEESGLVIEVDDEKNTGVHLLIAIDREFLRALMGSIDFKATVDVADWHENDFKEHKRRVVPELPEIPPSSPPLPDIPEGLHGG